MKEFLKSHVVGFVIGVVLLGGGFISYRFYQESAKVEAMWPAVNNICSTAPQACGIKQQQAPATAPVQTPAPTK